MCVRQASEKHDARLHSKESGRSTECEEPCSQPAPSGHAHVNLTFGLG